MGSTSSNAMFALFYEAPVTRAPVISEQALPDERARLKQAVLVNATLAARGYVAVGLDHFAKPDDPLAVAQRDHRLARNFQGYTTDNAPILIGLGASSIGSLPQGYVQNHTEVRAYRAAIDEGVLPVARGIALTDDDRLSRAIIERLMCDLQVDLGALTEGHNRTLDALAEPLKKLSPLLDDGIAHLDGSRLSVDPQWRIFVRPVCAAFDAYLGNSSAVHSKAV